MHAGPIPLGWQQVGQLSDTVAPVADPPSQPYIVVRPRTQIKGCVPSGIPDGNVVTDSDNGYVSANLPVCQTFG